MEPQFPLLAFLVTFFLFVFTVIKIFKDKNSTSKHPPGPWKLPVMGNMHQLVGSLPHHTLRDLAKKYGPLMQLQLGEVYTIIVSSPETAREVYKTHDINFSQRPYLLASRILSYGSTSIGFSPYGNYWRQLRKICILEMLSAKRIQTFRPIREEEVSKLVQSISSSAGSPINLSGNIFSLMYSVTSRAAFGMKSKDQEEFILAMKEVMELASGFSISDMYPSIKLLEVISLLRPKLEKLQKKVDWVLDCIIIKHKERKRSGISSDGEVEDLLDVLLKLQDHDDLEFPLTTENIKAVILDMFGGGSDTSSVTVEWAMSEMLKNPRIMKKAQAEARQVFNRKGNVDETMVHELTYLKLIIKETLRLHPPGPLLLPRESREKCEINGYEVPAKTKVIVNAWAIARDPKYWVQPEKFNPERFMYSSVDYKGANFEYLPFGGGRRICPGISFAQANVLLPLASLLYHFDWKLPGGMKEEDLDMSEDFGLTVRRKQSLHLIPIPYHPRSIS